jgi:aminoglycoside phosphotransferase family enzyme
MTSPAVPPTLLEKVEFLRVPSHYPGRVRRVTAMETHFAWVFLTAGFAFKLKKPLRQLPMDYRSLAARERGCRDEVRLNRRLAPRVYLLVVPLVRREEGGLALGGDGEAVDWLVRMRRLPANRMLDQILGQRSPSPREMAQLVTMLARFYRRAPGVRLDGRYVARLRSVIAENRRVLVGAGAGVDRALADDVAAWQRKFLHRSRDLVEARRPRLVDGHGDLRAEHVCLTRTPCVIDCLEFDARLRQVDPLAEVTALSLDFERAGRSAAAAEFISAFTGHA